MSAGGSVRDVGCAEIGGFRGWTNTPTPGCYTNTAETEELVTEQDSYNLYIEHNLEAGGLRFHTEALAYRQDIPNIALAGTFVNNPDAWPLAPSVNGAPRVQQNINGTNAYFVPGTNPAVANLLSDLRNPDGSTAFTAAQIAAITNPANPGRVGLQNFLWKPFGNGGSPRGDVDRQEGHLKMYRLTEAIGGDLPEFWGTNLEWEVALTYSYTEDLKEAEDILVTDMQAALNGFGGPNCTGTTPGANGCQWFNPFSSALERNVFTGAVNPYFESALGQQPRAGRVAVQPGVVQARVQELRRRSDRARRHRHRVARRSDQARVRRPVPPAGRARHDGCRQQPQQQSLHGDRRHGLRHHGAGRRMAVRPSADGVRRRGQRLPAGSAALSGGRRLPRDAAAAAAARST